LPNNPQIPPPRTETPKARKIQEERVALAHSAAKAPKKSEEDHGGEQESKRRKVQAVYKSQRTDANRKVEEAACKFRGVFEEHPGPEYQREFVEQGNED
jgi:hypothetical protein